MAHHEQKSCPRCGAPFECKVGSILQCQCNGLTFTDEEKEYVASNYRDCLCRVCLQQMKHEHYTIHKQQTLQTILSPLKRK